MNQHAQNLVKCEERQVDDSSVLSSGGDTQRLQTPSKQLSRSCRQHDKINLVVLPILSLSAVAGLIGFVSPILVTKLFLAYILVDLIWLCLDPNAVPSMQPVVVTHHIVTAVLLFFPYIHPSFAIFTCLDGLAEINTVFVIGRRYFSRNKHGGRIFNFLHWLSFIPLRFILFPILIFVFWQSLSGFPLWKKFWVCGAQVFLCVFNALFLHTILTRHKFYDTLKATLTGWDLDKPTTGTPWLDLKSRHEL